MQINGTTLDKRQKALIGGALHRELGRTIDAMRIINMPDVLPEDRVHVDGALILTIYEIRNLINLLDHDQEGADK